MAIPSIIEMGALPLGRIINERRRVVEDSKGKTERAQEKEHRYLRRRKKNGRACACKKWNCFENGW